MAGDMVTYYISVGPESHSQTTAYNTALLVSLSSLLNLSNSSAPFSLVTTEDNFQVISFDLGDVDPISAGGAKTEIILDMLVEDGAEEGTSIDASANLQYNSAQSSESGGSYSEAFDFTAVYTASLGSLVLSSLPSEGSNSSWLVELAGLIGPDFQNLSLLVSASSQIEININVSHIG